MTRFTVRLLDIARISSRLTVWAMILLIAACADKTGEPTDVHGSTWLDLGADSLQIWEVKVMNGRVYVAAGVSGLLEVRPSAISPISYLGFATKKVSGNEPDLFGVRTVEMAGSKLLVGLLPFTHGETPIFSRSPESSSFHQADSGFTARGALSLAAAGSPSELVFAVASPQGLFIARSDSLLWTPNSGGLLLNSYKVVCSGTKVAIFGRSGFLAPFLWYAEVPSLQWQPVSATQVFGCTGEGEICSVAGAQLQYVSLFSLDCSALYWTNMSHDAARIVRRSASRQYVASTNRSGSHLVLSIDSSTLALSSDEGTTWRSIAVPSRVDMYGLAVDWDQGIVYAWGRGGSGQKLFCRSLSDTISWNVESMAHGVIERDEPQVSETRGRTTLMNHMWRSNNVVQP